MPELPEVEAVIGMLRPEAIGATIQRVDVFRPRSVKPQDVSVLEATKGKRIEAIERRGKNIVLRLTGDLALRVHLRMTGILRVIPDARLYTASTRVLFTLKDRRGLAFEDWRIMGTVHVHSWPELEEKLSVLGPEPMTRAFTSGYLLNSAGRSSRADQGVSDGSEHCGGTWQYLCGGVAVCSRDSSGQACQSHPRRQASGAARGHPESASPGHPRCR